MIFTETHIFYNAFIVKSKVSTLPGVFECPCCLTVLAVGAEEEEEEVGGGG